MRTLSELGQENTFESVIYVDVLDVLEDDKTEARLAAGCLREGATLVVLAPAHKWLFTPFDQALGRYRRYDLNGLSRTIPEDLIKLGYLDCVGLLTLLGNRFFSRAGCRAGGR